jgi:hypothetical protein
LLGAVAVRTDVERGSAWLLGDKGLYDLGLVGDGVAGYETVGLVRSAVAMLVALLSLGYCSHRRSSRPQLHSSLHAQAQTHLRQLRNHNRVSDEGFPLAIPLRGWGDAGDSRHGGTVSQPSRILIVRYVRLVRRPYPFGRRVRPAWAETEEG